MLLELAAGYGAIRALTDAMNAYKGRRHRSGRSLAPTGSPGPAWGMSSATAAPQPPMMDFREFEVNDYEIVMRGRSHVFRR